MNRMCIRRRVEDASQDHETGALKRIPVQIPKGSIPIQKRENGTVVGCIPVKHNIGVKASDRGIDVPIEHVIQAHILGFRHCDVWHLTLILYNPGSDVCGYC